MYSSRHRLPAIIIFLLSLGLTMWVLWHLEDNRRAAKQSSALHTATNHTLLLMKSLEQAQSINYFMAAYLRMRDGDVSEFEKIAADIVPYYSAISFVALLPDGVVSRVFPLHGNKDAMGFNPLNDVNQESFVQHAIHGKHITFTPPIPLRQGGMGVVVRLPVYLNHGGDEKYWGLTSVIIRTEQLLNQSNIQQLGDDDLHYALYVSSSIDHRQIVASNAPTRLSDPVVRTVSLGNLEWTLEIQPKTGWTTPWRIVGEGLLGLAIASMLAWLTHLTMVLRSRRNVLQEAVDEQTRELQVARAELQATLDAIPDLLFDIDGEGVIHGYHSNQKELLTLEPQQFLGHNFRRFLPPNAIKLVEQAFDEARTNGVSVGKIYSISLARGVKTFELSVSRRSDDLSIGERFVVLARDISERRQAESELRVAATAFEAREGMMITNAEGIIIRVNNAFTEITGYGPEEAIGNRPNILRSGHHDANFYRGMWDQIRKNGRWRGEIWNRRKSGEVFPEWLTINAVRDDQGIVTHFVSTLTDITELKENEERIHKLAFYDPLTQLPNRRLLRDRLEHATAKAQREKTLGALLFIDLDDFKTLNDSRGHHIGDLLLIAVAERLRKTIREQDTIARLGGDEFVVVLDNLGTTHDEAGIRAQRVGENILSALNDVYVLEDQEYFNTPSIGICLFGEAPVPLEELLKQADQAMYQAKASGRNTLCFFDPKMQEITAQRFILQNQMRDALKLDQFQLYLQPQFDAGNQLYGAEALVRWHHPERGMVFPNDFIPIAENSGLIVPLGAWIVQAACEQLVRWSQDARTAQLSLSINISARQIQQHNFVEHLLVSIETTGANPARLKLELTETMLVNNPQDIIAKMDALKEHGIQFSLDDFGTGYSSLSYLKRLPINELKIDRSFVNDVLSDSNDAAIARMVIRLAQSLELNVIAEGVESEAQRDWLEQEGCFHYQGYYFGKPVPPEEFDRLVDEVSGASRL